MKSWRVQGGRRARGLKGREEVEERKGENDKKRRHSGGKQGMKERKQGG